LACSAKDLPIPIFSVHAVDREAFVEVKSLTDSPSSGAGFVGVAMTGDLARIARHR
jgi:hypothetical protein